MVENVRFKKTYVTLNVTYTKNGKEESVDFFYIHTAEDIVDELKNRGFSNKDIIYVLQQILLL